MEFSFDKHYVRDEERFGTNKKLIVCITSPVLATGCGWVNEEYQEAAHYGVLELFSLSRRSRLRKSVLIC